MRASLRRCPGCGRYTAGYTCTECGSDTVTAHPPKYSPDDRYGRYRRMSIRQEYGENGKCHHDKV